MHVPGCKRLLTAPILAAAILYPSGVEGQFRTVISNEISSSDQGASLRLGFQNGGEFSISLQDGQVLVDGEVLGTFARWDPLDQAWRELLQEVITLDDGPLAQRLNDWDPAEDLSGESRALAEQLDQALEEALTPPERLTEAQAVGETSGQEPGVVSALLSRTGALARLAEALEGASLDDVTLKIGENVEVGAGEEIAGDLVVVDGDLDLLGRVDGDVVLIGGTVRLGEESEITGDLRVSGGTLERYGGSISGSVVEVQEDEVRVREGMEELEQMRRELESEIRRELREARRSESRPRSLMLEVLGNIGSAIAGLLENLVTFLVLGVLGVLAVHFQRNRLEIISTTAHRAPVRSAVVGLAGGFFLLPVWILGTIALAITIIGIPVLLAWIPLFPIAAGMAILLGYLAVARNVGEWVAEQEYRGLEWIRGSNTFYTLVAGIGALMLPAVAANVSRVVGFDFLTGLLGFAGSMVTLAAGAVGFGAVLLTRGGKIRPLESYYDFEEDYWADADTRPGTSAPPTGDPGRPDSSPPEQPQGPDQDPPVQANDPNREEEEHD